MDRITSLLLTFLIFTFLMVGYFHPITALNQDLGRHLLTGEIIVKTLQVPSINLYAYTYPDFPFVNHHWFSEVAFYLIHQLTGYPGLFALWLGLIISACGLIFWQARAYLSLYVLFPLSILYLRILFERTELRPEGFSYLCLALIITLLYTYRQRFTKLIYLIIPIQLLWTNAHIYFPLGIIVLGLFCIDLAVTHRKKLMNHKVFTLFTVTFLSGITTLLNPQGLTGALYPLRVFQNYGYTIVENQTPFLLQQLGYANKATPYLEAATLLLFLSLILTLKKARLIDWLLSLTFTVLAYSAVRNFPLFVFTTFIPLSYALSQLVPTLKKHLSLLSLPISKIAALVIFGGILLWQIPVVLRTYPMQYALYEDGAEALTFFQKNKLKGPIFNNFDIGSYIESRLYPQEKVFIDGRPEAYPASFIQQTYIKMQEDPALFTKVAKQYDFQTIIFAHTDQTPWGEQFIKDIVVNPDWSTVYLDASMIILLRKTPENERIIKQFGMNPNTLQMQPPQDERKLRMAAHFYSIVQDRKNLERTLVQLLDHRPTDCAFLQGLLTLYVQEQNPLTTMYGQRFHEHCQ